MEKIKTELWWLIHNTIGHPISGVCNLLGNFVPKLKILGNWIHDITIPN